MATGPRWEPAQPTFGLTSSGGCVPTDDLRVSLVPSGGGPVARAPPGRPLPGSDAGRDRSRRYARPMPRGRPAPGESAHAVGPTASRARRPPERAARAPQRLRRACPRAGPAAPRSSKHMLSWPRPGPPVAVRRATGRARVPCRGRRGRRRSPRARRGCRGRGRAEERRRLPSRREMRARVRAAA